MITATDESRIVATIIKGSLSLLGLLVAAAFLFSTRRIAFGILAGGIITLVNFFWLRTVLQRVIGLLPDNPQRYAMMRYLARMTVTGYALYLVLTSSWFSVAGVLIGLSVIVVNIIALSLYGALRTGG